jgi:hypothetical protein
MAGGASSARGQATCCWSEGQVADVECKIGRQVLQPELLNDWQLTEGY